VADSLLPCRVTDNAELYIYLEEVFQRASSAGEWDAECEVMQSYLQGVGSFFDALYMQEDPADKKKLLHQGARLLSRAVLRWRDSAQRPRRLRALWFLYRLLRLIVCTDHLHAFLNDLGDSLDGLVAGSVSREELDGHREVRLSFVAYHAKILFENHRRVEALAKFQRAEELLRAEHFSGEEGELEKPLTMPGWGTVLWAKKDQEEIRKHCEAETTRFRDALDLHIAVVLKERRDFDGSLSRLGALFARNKSGIKGEFRALSQKLWPTIAPMPELLGGSLVRIVCYIEQCLCADVALGWQLGIRRFWL
jgi:hypothetical protein